MSREIPVMRVRRALHVTTPYAERVDYKVMLHRSQASRFAGCSPLSLARTELAVDQTYATLAKVVRP